MRLEKVVANQSGLSRREAREAIRRGRVAVAGRVVRSPSAAVGAADAVALDGVDLGPPPLLVLCHKPVGVQCVVGDPAGRPDLRSTVGHWLDRGLHPVGRLDADTSGLLPLSSSGALTQRLLHPRHGVKKTYRATVEGRVQPERLRQRLAAGVQTALGTHTAVLEQAAGAALTVTVTEGKHRMVRRMLANTGHPVVTLQRLAFGAFRLGALPVGADRPATVAECAWAEALLQRA